MSRDFNTADAIQADLIAGGARAHGLKEWRAADGQPLAITTVLV
jgi:hypothetical protein